MPKKEVAVAKAELASESFVAFAILLIPLGLASDSNIPIVGLGIPVVVASLMAVPAFLVLSSHIDRYRSSTNSTFAPLVGIALISVGLMVPPLMLDINQATLLSFYHFSAGTTLGVVSGVVYAQCRSRWSRIDWAISVVLVVEGTIVIYQALGEISRNGFSDGLRLLHGSVDLGWGSSNFAAGCLVVMAAILLSRRVNWAARALPRVAVGLTIAAVFLTTSRGALVALTLAVIVLMLNSDSTSKRTSKKWVMRGGVLFVLVGAYAVFEGFNTARSSSGFDPSQNIDSRFELYDYALASFLRSPIIGTGWLGMRDMPGTADPISFAHNIVLSFLQIGGFFGLAYLIIFITLSIRAFKAEASLRPALIAIVVMSFTDPMLEGFMGSFLAWMMLAATVPVGYTLGKRDEAQGRLPRKLGASN